MCEWIGVLGEAIGVPLAEPDTMLVRPELLPTSVGAAVTACCSEQAMAAKMSARFAAGDSAFLTWDWLTDPLGPCGYSAGPSESALLGAIGSPLSG